MAQEKNLWGAKGAGSGNFAITKPKRKKTKMRASRVKNVRRAR